MIKIVADDKIPFLHGVLESFINIKYLTGNAIDWNVIKDADALLIRTRTKCTPQLLKGTKVKFIGTATIGFDHIDTGYCESNNIKWVNAAGCNSSSVQQYIAAALLKLSWEFKFGLKGKTIGIIGVGNVGSKVAKFCSILGMNVLLNDPPRARREGGIDFVDIGTILEESDIITLHTPLSFVGEDKTYHMINDATIKKMKKGAWLINSSRGEEADTLSLKKAVKAGRLGGIVADVWENEPDIDQVLMHNAFIATPHIAGYSTDGKANGTSMVVNDMAAFFGLPIKDWFPPVLPEPGNPVINIDGRGKDNETIVREAVAHTYNIDEDDTRLRFSPSDFEKLRGNYQVRREFPAYKVSLANGKKNTISLLSNLGFSCSSV